MRRLNLAGFFLIISLAARGQFITNNGIGIKNSAALTTNGDWTSDPGTMLLNNGTISMTESFINKGTLDKSGTGGFAFQFDTEKNFQPGNGPMGFLKKTGPGAMLLTGSISVRDSLFLQDGILRMVVPSDTIAIRAGAVVKANASSYIEGGFIAGFGTGDLVLPFGRDGNFVPLKMYKVRAQRFTASLIDAPAHTAGPGVDAMIGFPYAFRITKKIAADTAAYVEINYPNTLPTVVNPIVVREVGGSQFASMGARNIADTGVRTTVKSYSRRLQGLFTVAQGFPSDFVTDSLALVSLYNGTGGPAWTNRGNWLTGPVDTWFGVTVTGQSITSVELPNNGLSGPVPDPLVDILSLQTINLSANDITALPDFTLNPEITSLNVSDNNLDFASLEPNAAITGISYFIQGDLGVPLDTAISVGSPYTFELIAGGLSSQYKWKRNGVDVPGANQSAYLLPAITRSTMGEYTAEITNPNLPGLVLKSVVQKVLAYADVSGKLYASATLPAERGNMTLYRVQPGAFAPLATEAVAADGSYLFEKVILDDYQLRGFADTLVHERALPTYFVNTIFWEEADTLFLEGNLSELDIVSQLEPEPPSGRGSISGYLQEDDGTGRVTDPERNKRVEAAGVSARRVEHAGRTREEILILVAYVFTNEQGEFTLPNLPTGEYRLNFQYPGYPMDETSYTTITIGTGFESQVQVEANVIDGKINVRKLVITGLYEAPRYSAEVFPNPTADFIRLKFEHEGLGRTIVLTDNQGKAVRTSVTNDKDVLLDVRMLTNGLYILQIKENGIKMKTLKVSVE